MTLGRLLKLFKPQLPHWKIEITVHTLLKVIIKFNNPYKEFISVTIHHSLSSVPTKLHKCRVPV